MLSAKKKPFNKINDNLWSKFLSHLEQPNHNDRCSTVERNTILIDTTEDTSNRNVYSKTTHLANDADNNDDRNDENINTVVVLSSDSENENETIWSNNYKAKGFTRLWEKARFLILHRLIRGFPCLKTKDYVHTLENENVEDQLFPYGSLRELSEAVRRFHQDNNLSKKELSFLWSNIIQWLTAIKLSPSDPLDLNYDEKYNLIIIDFMIQYINNVTKSYNNVTCKDEIQRKINEMIQTMSVVFNGSSSHAIMTLLRIEYKMEYRILLEPILKKYLEDRNLRKTSNDLIVYLRLVFCFKKWKTIIPLKTEREKINEIAIGKISRCQKTGAGIGTEVHNSADNVSILPKSVPKTNIRNQAFVSISDLIGFAIKRKDLGTKSLLVYTSLDLDDAITNYFNLYERYITMYTISHSDEASVLLSQMKIGNSRSSLPKKICQRNFNIGNSLVQQSQQKKLAQHRSSNFSRSLTKNSYKKQHLSTVCDINNFSLSESDSLNKDTKSKKKSNLSVIHIDSTDDDNDHDDESLDLPNLNSNDSGLISVSEKTPVDNKVQEAKHTETSLSASENSKTFEQRTDKNKEINNITLEVSSEEDNSKSANQTPQPNRTHSNKTDNTSKVQNEKRTEADVRNQRFVAISPSRCRALVKCVATKPTRKEKHCIPGEVSSTTSPDNVVAETTATFNSESLEVHSAGGSCQNAREVGTVKVVEQRITPYQPVIINGTYNGGSSILGIDYSDISSENEDDDENTSSSHQVLSSHYWKVVEEATSSTEIFQKTQCKENVLFSTPPLSTEVIAPIEQNLLPPNTSCQNLLDDNVPICSKYLNNKSRKIDKQIIENPTQKSSTPNRNQENNDLNENVNETTNTENLMEKLASSKQQEINETDTNLNLQSEPIPINKEIEDIPATALDGKNFKSVLSVILKDTDPQEGLVIKEANDLSSSAFKDKNINSDLPVMLQSSDSQKVLVNDEVKKMCAATVEDKNSESTTPVSFKNAASHKVITKKLVSEIPFGALEDKMSKSAVPGILKNTSSQEVLIEEQTDNISLTTLEDKNCKSNLTVILKDSDSQKILVNKKVEEIFVTSLEDKNSMSAVPVILKDTSPQKELVHKQVQDISLTSQEDKNSKTDLRAVFKDLYLQNDLANLEVYGISLSTQKDKLALLLKDSDPQKVSSLESSVRFSKKLQSNTKDANDEEPQKMLEIKSKDKSPTPAEMVLKSDSSLEITETYNKDLDKTTNKKAQIEELSRVCPDSIVIESNNLENHQPEHDMIQETEKAENLKNIANDSNYKILIEETNSGYSDSLIKKNICENNKPNQNIVQNSEMLEKQSTNDVYIKSSSEVQLNDGALNQISSKCHTKDTQTKQKRHSNDKLSILNTHNKNFILEDVTLVKDDLKMMPSEELSDEDVEKSTPWKMRIKRRKSQCSDFNREFSISKNDITLNQMPSNYNSEEILAVATLINMRNKNVPLSTLPGSIGLRSPENNEPEILNDTKSKSALKTQNNSSTLMNKKVRFDEKNLLELESEKPFKTTKNSLKLKLKTIRSNEGALLKDENKNKKTKKQKYIMQRLAELNASFNLSPAVQNGIEIIGKFSNDAKKRRSRNKTETSSSLDEQNNSATDAECLGKKLNISNSVYPVRLTSRRESIVNEMYPPIESSKTFKKNLKYYHVETSNEKIYEENIVSESLILPDEKIAGTIKETIANQSDSFKDPKINIRTINADDGTKIKIKIKTPEPNNTLKEVGFRETNEKKISKRKNRGKNYRVLEQKLLKKMLKRKAVVRIQRLKLTNNTEVSSNHHNIREAVEPDVLPVPNLKVVDEIVHFQSIPVNELTTASNDNPAGNNKAVSIENIESEYFPVDKGIVKVDPCEENSTLQMKVRNAKNNISVIEQPGSFRTKKHDIKREIILKSCEFILTEEIVNAQAAQCFQECQYQNVRATEHTLMNENQDMLNNSLVAKSRTKVISEGVINQNKQVVEKSLSEKTQKLVSENEQNTSYIVLKDGLNKKPTIKGNKAEEKRKIKENNVSEKSIPTQQIIMLENKNRTQESTKTDIVEKTNPKIGKTTKQLISQQVPLHSEIEIGKEILSKKIRMGNQRKNTSIKKKIRQDNHVLEKITLQKEKLHKENESNAESSTLKIESKISRITIESKAKITTVTEKTISREEGILQRNTFSTEIGGNREISTLMDKSKDKKTVKVSKAKAGDEIKLQNVLETTGSSQQTLPIEHSTNSDYLTINDKLGKKKIKQDEKFVETLSQENDTTNCTSKIKSKKVATTKEAMVMRSPDDLKNISKNRKVEINVKTLAQRQTQKTENSLKNSTMKTKHKMNAVETDESERLVDEKGQDSTIATKITKEQNSNDKVDLSTKTNVKSRTVKLKDVTRKRKIEQNNQIVAEIAISPQETQSLENEKSSDVSETKKRKMVQDCKTATIPEKIYSKESIVEETNSKSLATEDLDTETNVQNKKIHASINKVTDDIANKIAEVVIAELKLLSPDCVMKNENDECSKEIECKTDTLPDNCKQSPLNDNSTQQESDAEQQKTAKLLDTSIEIVLRNSKENAAEKINNSIEKILGSKRRQSFNENKLMAKTPTKLLHLTNICNDLTNENISCFKFSTKADEESTKKILSRNALNDVKIISANVPDALFADDVSENSSSEDNTNIDEFYAPILSLNDLVIKKDDPVTTQPFINNTENSMETNNRHCLGTPSFTVELEEKTIQSVDNIHSSSLAINKTANSLESKCAESEELNPNLEVEEAPFTLSVIDDINAIDIPNDLSMTNNYPDLLDTILFDQVQQSIDCMISGKNSLSKWSQNRFVAPSKENRNQTEINNRNENSELSINSDLNVKHAKQITAGNNSFLDTINTFEEVAVSTATGLDLVSNLTMEDFLGSDGDDFFGFSELDKTQSRSNSFTNDDDDEDANKTQSHHIKTVACNHSYNKDIKSIQTPEVNKNVRTSKPSSPNAKQSQSNALPNKTLTSTNKSPERNIFSKSKCTPKPFWKVKKNDKMKTSTPRKLSNSFDETISLMDNTEKCNSSAPNIDINACKDVYNMPVLEFEMNSLLTNDKKLSVGNITPQQIDSSKPALRTSSLLSNNGRKSPAKTVPLKQINSLIPTQSTIITKISNVPSQPKHSTLVNITGNVLSATAQSTMDHKIENMSSVSGKSTLKDKNICNVSSISTQSAIVSTAPQTQSRKVKRISNVSSAARQFIMVNKTRNVISTQSPITHKVFNISSLPEQSLIVKKSSSASSCQSKRTGGKEDLVTDSATQLKPQIKCDTLKNKDVESPAEVTKPITNANLTIIPQPIIRIQSQTNRLERIDPIMCEPNYISRSQSESCNESSNLDNINITITQHRSRESTPTMDEISKDEDVFDSQISPYNTGASSSKKVNSKKPSKRESTTQLEFPPAKKIYFNKTVENLRSNVLFDILKRDNPASKAASKSPEKSRENIKLMLVFLFSLIAEYRRATGLNHYCNFDI